MILKQLSETSSAVAPSVGNHPGKRLRYRQDRPASQASLISPCSGRPIRCRARCLKDQHPDRQAQPQQLSRTPQRLRGLLRSKNNSA